MSQFLEIVMHYLFRIVAKSARKTYNRKTGKATRKRTFTETASTARPVLRDQPVVP